MKILIWGVGGAYAIHRNILKELEYRKYIEILAVIDNNAVYGKIDGYPVINKRQISQYNYDKIVIAAYGVGTNSIREDIANMQIKEAVSIQEFLFGGSFEDIIKEDYYNNIRKQLKVLEEILNASDEEAAEYNWMYQRVCEYGIYCFTRDWPDYKSVNWTRYGMQQIIEEFTEFCCYISKINVESAVEIGVFKGRSSYFICAVLARKNKNLKYNLIDIQDNLDSYDKFYEILPMMNKQIPCTSEICKEKHFDFVFIDGDHSYNGAITDWNNVGKNADKIVAFHDIYAHEYDNEDGGIVRAWEEIKDTAINHQHKIFSKYKNQWMGIGCIEK